MVLNQIRDHKGATHRRKRVGRGIGSGTGKTAGRGYKGQKSRSGVALLGFEGGQMPLYRRLPKRGFKNPSKPYYAVVNTGHIQLFIDNGKLNASEPITATILKKSGLLSRTWDGVRLLAKGELKSKITIEVAGFSTKAKEIVEAKGGTIIQKAAEPSTIGEIEEKSKVTKKAKETKVATKSVKKPTASRTEKAPASKKKPTKE